MSITCKICNKEFAKIIPWQHLKTHDISTNDYKIIHGPVYSNETLAKFEKRIPHNKGKKLTDPAQILKLLAGVKLREERFQRGEFIRGSSRTDAQKQVLSNKSTAYGKANPDKMRDRAAKAIASKREKGYDFGSVMRGKKHSPESKQLMAAGAARANVVKTSQSIDKVLENIHNSNLSLLSDVQSNILRISCNICSHEFEYTRQYFVGVKNKINRCPMCFPFKKASSVAEIEMYTFIQSLGVDAISNYREHYHSKEIDIFIPSINIGFEFNGLYWHSDKVLAANGRSEKYDREKQLFFAEKGIQIIDIFEDEWHNKQAIVKSRISNILKKTDECIYARKCQIKEVSSKDASKFCDDTHMMGKGRSNIRIGLYFNNELISLMTFTSSNISRRLVNTWEINRFSSKLNTNVVGAASRLFKYFINLIHPISVVSYSDNRWSTGDLYNHLGFTMKDQGTPNYWYVARNTLVRIHRYTLRKNKEDDQTLTEYENRSNQGYLRIWDCGSSKWIWNSD